MLYSQLLLEYIDYCLVIEQKIVLIKQKFIVDIVSTETGPIVCVLIV